MGKQDAKITKLEAQVDVLLADLRESEELRTKAIAKRDEARDMVMRLRDQLHEALRNKAMLEAQLRCRLSGLTMEQLQ